MAEMTLLENTKILLKSLVNSSATPVTINMLNKDYHKSEGENIPYTRLGYRDLKTFLRSMPDTLLVNNQTEIVNVVHLKNSASKHISKFVSEQKVPKSRRSQLRAGVRQDRHSTKPIQSTYKQQSGQRVSHQYNPTPNQTHKNSVPKFQPGLFSTPPNMFHPSYPNSFYAADKWNANQMPNSASKFQPGVLLAPPALFNVPVYPNSFHAADWRNAQQNRVSATYNTKVNNILPSELKNSSASSTSSYCKRTENRNYDAKKDNVVQAMSSLDINSPDQPQKNDDTLFPSKENSVSTNAVDTNLNGDMESSSNGNSLSNAAVPHLNDDDSIHLIGTGYASSKYGKKIPAQIIPEILLGEDSLQIHISEVASPWKFWFHLIDEEYSMDVLQENLNSMYSSNPRMSISTSLMKVGYACVAYHNNKWMRAEFVDKPNNDMVKLLFVDFGTIDDVSIDNISFLTSGLCCIPRKCYRGALHIIKPNNENEIEKATLLFCEIVRNKVLIGIVTNVDKNNTVDLVIVDTSLPNEDIIVNQQLTKNVFPERTPQK